MLIRITQFTQIQAEAGTADDYSLGVVHFDLKLGDVVTTGLVAQVKQTAGGSHAEAPLEVFMPDGYDGPLNYDCFRASVTDYVRKMVPQFGPGARDI